MVLWLEGTEGPKLSSTLLIPPLCRWAFVPWLVSHGVPSCQALTPLWPKSRRRVLPSLVREILPQRPWSTSPVSYCPEVAAREAIEGRTQRRRKLFWANQESSPGAGNREAKQIWFWHKKGNGIWVKVSGVIWAFSPILLFSQVTTPRRSTGGTHPGSQSKHRASMCSLHAGHCLLYGHPNTENQVLVVLFKFWRPSSHWWYS